MPNYTKEPKNDHTCDSHPCRAVMTHEGYKKSFLKRTRIHRSSVQISQRLLQSLRQSSRGFLKKYIERPVEEDQGINQNLHSCEVAAPGRL